MGFEMFVALCNLFKVHATVIVTLLRMPGLQYLHAHTIHIHIYGVGLIVPSVLIFFDIKNYKKHYIYIDTLYGAFRLIKYIYIYKNIHDLGVINIALLIWSEMFF